MNDRENEIDPRNGHFAVTSAFDFGRLLGSARTRKGV